MIRYLIADDLTGAADASVHFAGSRVVQIQIPLRSRWGALGNGLSEPDGLTVVDTESRHLPADQAAAAVTLACRNLGAGVFKKVDSTLRGSIVAELKAACLALGKGTAVLAPSLPGQGRMVRGGRLLVGGVDAGGVTEILGAEVVPVPVAALSGGSLAPLVVIDATTDADLDRVAVACEGRSDLLPAGSAGLAAAFARLEGAVAPTTVPPCRRVLVAVASPHPAARAQLAALAAEPHPAIQVLAVPDDAEGLPEALAATLGREVARHLGEALPPLGGIPPLRGGATIVLATGGDAALAVCRELDFASLRPRAEVMPGVVWSDAGREDVALATKAGGFGGSRLLLDAALKLLGMDSRG